MPSHTRAFTLAQQATHAPPDPTLLQVRSTGPRGKGLFVTRDTPRGTRLTNEEPLFIVYDRPASTDGEFEASSEQDVDVFCRTAQGLPPDKLRALDRLHYDADYDTAGDKDRIREWLVATGARGDKGGLVLAGRNLAYATVVMARRYTIFKDNSARVGVDATGEDSGLFPLYSRINHGCSPNAHAHYNATTERLTVHATRDLEAGEEVLVQYMGVACKPRELRQEEVQKHGFACLCPVCVDDPLPGVVRERMYRLEQGIMHYVDEDPVKGVDMPKSPRVALAWIDELMKLLQDPDIDLRNITLRNALVILPVPFSLGVGSQVRGCVLMKHISHTQVPSSLQDSHEAWRTRKGPRVRADGPRANLLLDRNGRHRVLEWRGQE